MILFTMSLIKLDRQYLPINKPSFWASSIIPSKVSLKDFPSSSLLSFNVKNNLISFKRYPLSKVLYLQNKSLTEDLSYFVQCMPSCYFRVVPAHGTIKKGETCQMTLFCHSSIDVQPISAKINGYLRLKTADGLPIER